MSDKTASRETAKTPPALEREQRLARALRDNLLKRKAQQRSRASASGDDASRSEPGEAG
jgi:hypothetical protein